MTPSPRKATLLKPRPLLIQDTRKSPRRPSTYRNTVAFTHQCGRSAAIWKRAVAALRRLSNRAKQVAPEPDIRISFAWGACESNSSASAIAGATRNAPPSRSLRPETRASNVSGVSRAGLDDLIVEPDGRPRAPKTCRVGTGTPGFTRTANI